MAQGVLAVLWLVTGLGVLDEDFLLLAGVWVGVLVAQAHTRLHLVDILAAGTTRAESVPRHQRRLHLHLYRVIDQRGDKHRRERCHALALGVVGRHTHQAMHAVLALEVSVGEVTLDIYRARLDARLVTFEEVGNRGLVAMFLAIAQVHAHQHLRPVLALGAPRAGVDFQDHSHMVLLAAEHVAQLQGLDFGHRRGIHRVELGLLEQLLLVEIPAILQLIHSGLDFLVAVHPGLQVLDFLHLGLRLLGMLPEVRHMGAELLLLDLYLLIVDIEIPFERVLALHGLFKLFLSNHIRDLISPQSYEKSLERAKTVCDRPGGSEHLTVIAHHLQVDSQADGQPDDNPHGERPPDFTAAEIDEIQRHHEDGTRDEQ